MLKLLMRLVKDECAHLKPDSDDYYFPSDTFARVVKGIVSADNLDDEVKAEWVETYVDAYEDVRYSFFVAIKYVFVALPRCFASPPPANSN